MTDRGVGGKSNRLFGLLKRMLQDFTFKAEYAYDYGMPQWVAGVDHVFMSLHFERMFLGRHKFYHFRIWYRDELSGYVEEILSDRRTNQRPYFDKAFLKKMAQGHRKGNRNFTREIHQAISMELIHRLFIDN
jgi:asparagine synthase (glutamine-hydrolysing)